MTVTLDLSRATPSAVPSSAPANLSGLTRPALAAALTASGILPADKVRMRAGQIWRWVHHAGVTDFSQMSDIAKETSRPPGSSNGAKSGSSPSSANTSDQRRPRICAS